MWFRNKDFVAGMDQNTESLGVTFLSTLSADLTNEARLGRGWDDLDANPNTHGIPILTSLDGTTLPGTPIFSAFVNHTRSWELVDNLTRAQGRHVVTVGGNVLLRGISGILTAGQVGQYGFNTITDFAQDKASLFRIPLDRMMLPTFSIPNPARDYRSDEFFLFAQDSFRLTPRFVLNYGVRYESFGAPTNVGPVKDALVTLGSGSTFAARLAGAATLQVPSAGDESFVQRGSQRLGRPFWLFL